jgi:spoIIIJ-associated protein
MSDQTSDKSIDEAALFAKKFLEDMLSFFGLNTDVYATVNGDEIIELHVPSTHLNGFLIGGRGETIRAIQFMVSNALRSQQFEQSRVHVDIADYKKQRADRLETQAQEWIKQVKDSGEPMELKPMNAADRRIIHKVADDEGLTTESLGEGRDRYVVIKTKE